MKKIAVIGAGPAGITAAYELSKSKDVEVHLYEASSAVGGMSKTIELWNQKVDLGPHRFFSSDPRINKLWLEVIGDDYEMVDRLTRIYYKGKFYYYPLKAFNALKNLGIFKAIGCVLSYFKSRLFPVKGTDNFENWVIDRFGEKLYSIFFKTYSEKLWGIPCTELDSEFAAQRIKKLSLFEAVKNAIFKGGNKHKTLVDQFAYPHQGTGEVYERMKTSIEANNGSVFLSTKVKRIIHEGFEAKGLEDENGVAKMYDHVISTMPITTLVKGLDNVPSAVVNAANALRFRNTILVYLKVEAKDLFPDQWLYVHSEDLKTGRVTNFRNWVPSLYGEEDATIVVMEYWCYDNDAEWKQDEKGLIDLATKELKSTGLIKDAEVSEGLVYRVPKCYPVYNTGYKNQLKVVEDYMRQFNGLDLIGRYGSFKYNNQDHSILMGLLIARNLLDGQSNDLWDINTDYEYQESSTITKAGLVEAEA